MLAKTGIGDVEWIRSTVDEARFDPVGMWRMVRAGREQFALGGVDLEDFVRRFLTKMIEAGVNPVVGDSAARDRTSQQLARAQVDPDVGGVWFPFQSVWE